jgi:hypothetical protein
LSLSPGVQTAAERPRIQSIQAILVLRYEDKGASGAARLRPEMNARRDRQLDVGRKRQRCDAGRFGFDAMRLHVQVHMRQTEPAKRHVQSVGDNDDGGV